MKPKSLHLEAYMISETARRLGYKSTKKLYRLLSCEILEDYVYLESSGRVYLIIEPPNLPSLAEKIKTNTPSKRNINRHLHLYSSRTILVESRRFWHIDKAYQHHFYQN